MGCSTSKNVLEPVSTEENYEHSSQRSENNAEWIDKNPSKMVLVQRNSTLPKVEKMNSKNRRSRTNINPSKIGSNQYSSLNLELFNIYAHIDQSLPTNPYIIFLVTLLLTPNQHKELLRKRSIDDIHTDAYQVEPKFIHKDILSIEDFRKRNNRYSLFMEKQKLSNEYVGVSLFKWITIRSNFDDTLQFLREIHSWLDNNYLWSIDLRLFLLVEKDPLRSLLYFAQSWNPSIQIAAVELLFKVSFHNISPMVKTVSIFAERIHQSIDIHFIAASWFSKVCDIPLDLKIVTITREEMSCLLHAHKLSLPLSEQESWLDKPALNVQSPLGSNSPSDQFPHFPSDKNTEEILDPIHSQPLQNLIVRIDNVISGKKHLVNIGTISLCSTPTVALPIKDNSIDNTVPETRLPHTSINQTTNEPIQTSCQSAEVNESCIYHEALHIDSIQSSQGEDVVRKIIDNSNICTFMHEKKVIHSLVNDLEDEETEFDLQFHSHSQCQFQPQQQTLNMQINFLPGISTWNTDLWTRTRIFIYHEKVTAACPYYIEENYSTLYASVDEGEWQVWVTTLLETFSINKIQAGGLRACNTNFISDIIRERNGNIRILAVYPFHSSIDGKLFDWNSDWVILIGGSFVFRHNYKTIV